MESLKDIKRRMSAVGSTQKITRAMKLVAAQKLRQTQAVANGGREYAEELHRVIERISKRLGERAPVMWRRSSSINCIDMLVITSDRGLCGSFNESLIYEVVEGIHEHKQHNIDVKIFSIGYKGYEYFKSKGYDVERISNNMGTEVAVRTAVSSIMVRFLYGESSGSYVAFNRSIKSASREITFWNLLPLYSQGVADEKAIEYLFEPERDLALDFFASEMLMSTVRQAIYESMASELSARVIAMSQATKNADDMITHLKWVYNKVRQEVITDELMDIVGGANAIMK